MILYEDDGRNLSHFPPILLHGTSLILAHEHSTTAAPYCSNSSLSAVDTSFLAFGLELINMGDTALRGRGSYSRDDHS